MKKAIPTEEDILNDLFSTPEQPETTTRNKETKSKVKTPAPKKKTLKEDIELNTMFKIDTDLIPFYENIIWITRESKRKYLNRLIRNDFLNKIGATDSDSEATLNKKWNQYIEKLNKVLENM